MIKNHLHSFIRHTGKYLSVCCELVLSLLSGCSDKNVAGSLIIVSKKTLHSIPSASGIAIKNNTAYIIGDDATGVYAVDLNNFQQQKIPVSGWSNNEYRIPKSVKHDFESATIVNWQGKEYLLAFGSGSNTSSRNNLLMMNTSSFGDHSLIPLQDFYKQLQLLTHTDATQWNVEGATATNGNLILLNRGNNMIVTCSLTEFLLYLLNDNAPFPAVEHHSVQLPSIGEHEARFSGACSLNDTSLLFSASVEDTPDWIQDGPILGSYIGIYSIQQKKVLASWLLENSQNHPLKEKIESLEIVQKEPNGLITLLAVTDNDDGTSNIFQLQLQHKTLLK